MDRLLSEQEMRTIGLCVISQSRDGCVTGEGVTQMQIDTAKAQLAKADKEWVERMEKYGDSCKCGFCPYRIPDCFPANMSCFLWQQLKREVGQ